MANEWQPITRGDLTVQGDEWAGPRVVASIELDREPPEGWDVLFRSAPVAGNPYLRPIMDLLGKTITFDVPDDPADLERLDQHMTYAVGWANERYASTIWPKVLQEQERARAEQIGRSERLAALQRTVDELNRKRRLG